MNNSIKTALIFLLVLFIPTTGYSQSHELALQYFYKAQNLRKQGKYLEAARTYEKSAEAEKNSPKPRLDDLLGLLILAGSSNYQVAQYDKALKYHVEALAIARRLGKKDKVTRSLNNIGMVYFSWGQYNNALKYYEEALATGRTLGKDDDVDAYLNNIGVIYGSWGQYDNALKYHEEALATGRKLVVSKYDVAECLSNIGVIYNSWGQYDNALKYHEEALEIGRKLGQNDKVAMYLSNIGMVYSSLGQRGKALKYHEEALEINRRLGCEDSIAVNLLNIGMVYFSWGQYNKAIKYHEEALEINRRLGKEDKVATCLNNIGCAYLSLKKHEEAIKNLNLSVELKEKLRKTATGDVRRDYLASQIYTYQLLISSYVRNNDLSKAFETIELSRAKLLAERLAESEISIPSVKLIQRKLPEDTAILTFANVNRQKKVVITITNENIYGTEISDDEFINYAVDRYEPAIKLMIASKSFFDKARGIKIVETEKENKLKEGKIGFEDIINYYISLLNNPLSSVSRGIKIQKTNAGSSNNLGHILYDLLVKPLASHIKDKKRLIIIPDGVLGFVPFETLTDDNGDYLVENYNISYAQSMGVLELIDERKYKTNRKHLLAFGGAVYDEITYTADMIHNEKQWEDLLKNVYASFDSSRSVRNAYASLDVAEWTNLPGSMNEVKKIAGIVRNAKVLTGKEVTESRIKEMSAKGSLSEYKVLHFATHALVMPFMPELSAIVLSQLIDDKSGEDGYLRMQEIAELNIKADFVNLSACDTARGKVYGGEGVVGLSQAFMIAGANGLSASLWKVDDISTSHFMVALYELVKQKGVGYNEAIAEIKRRFIKGDFGDSYKAPYYWGPFVYYGK